MLSALGEINKGLVHVPAMWGGMWEAHSLRTQAPQLQSRLDVNFKTQVEEWRRKDDAAVRMQSCFRVPGRHTPRLLDQREDGLKLNLGIDFNGYTSRNPWRLRRPVIQ